MLDAKTQSPSNAKDAEFVPKGSIAFFIVMLASFGLIWLGMYLLLVHRQVGL